MARHPILSCAFLGALLGSPLLSQLGPPPVVNPPNFSVSLRAAGLLASGASMAADRFGNVYIEDQATTTATGSITKVGPNGVQPQFVGNLGALSQIAYDPADGFCYVASWSPILPVVNSSIWRIDPVQGAVAAGNVALIASGFTIDDAGLMYFGTQTAVQGAGLYRHDPGGPAGNATYLGPGFASNAILQSIVSGDILIAGGSQVRRLSPASVGTVPYYAYPGPMPNTLVQVNSLARTPFNQIGSGALIGIREFVTVCLCGQGLAVTAGLTGQNPQVFASEPFASPFVGLRCIASGLAQDAWWYTDEPGPGPIAGKLLWRIRQVPAHGAQGSLIASVAAGVATIDIYGPAGGGDPFLFGAASAPPPADMARFVPPFGIVDLFPFHPLYLPVLDGVGVFGPPDPFAVVPAGGHFQWSVGVPPGLSGLSFDLQSLTVAPAAAPNGLFFISNVETLALP